MANEEEREIIVNLGGRPALSLAMTVSVAAIEAIEHNQWRYGELQKLRRGQPNEYGSTSYR